MTQCVTERVSPQIPEHSSERGSVAAFRRAPLQREECVWTPLGQLPSVSRVSLSARCQMAKEKGNGKKWLRSVLFV